MQLIFGVIITMILLSLMYKLISFVSMNIFPFSEIYKFIKEYINRKLSGSKNNKD